MDEIKETSKYFAEYLLGFLKWVLISALTGAVGGVIGSLFHISVEKVTGFRNAHEWIIVFLPIAGLLIVLLYRAFGLEEKIGTNDILNAVRKKKKGVPAAAVWVYNKHTTERRRDLRCRLRKKSPRFGRG